MSYDANNYYTSLKWAQYVVEEPHQGLPHDWKMPLYTARYIEGWIPVRFTSDSDDELFGLVNLSGVASAAYATASVLLATLVAIAN